MDERGDGDIRGGDGALVKAITGTAVSEGALMTYHNGMAVGVHTPSALSRRVA